MSEVERFMTLKMLLSVRHTHRVERHRMHGKVILAAFITLGSANIGAAEPVKPGPVASAPAGHTTRMAKKPRVAPPPAKLVDLNSASRAELKTLPGIGDPEAAKIIASRPFLTKGELVTKHVIPTGPYLSLKDRVMALPKAPPKARP
jgi:DNA uptake protein ComE-like DNA-binding protein